MVQVQQMVLFARVVDAGSFAAAAKLLGQTRAAVSKQIAVLEDKLAVDTRDAFDVAIRIAPRTDSSLSARRLADSAHVVCGTPDYFAREGVPESPDDLRHHRCLIYSALPTPRLWRFRDRKT